MKNNYFLKTKKTKKTSKVSVYNLSTMLLTNSIGFGSTNIHSKQSIDSMLLFYLKKILLNVGLTVVIFEFS